MDIIEDVGDDTIEWCSNVVLTLKKDRENIRASLDMTDAIKYIKRTRHAIPTYMKRTRHAIPTLREL